MKYIDTGKGRVWGDKRSESRNINRRVGLGMCFSFKIEIHTIEIYFSVVYQFVFKTPFYNLLNSLYLSYTK